jgi:hypothetical protein
VESEFDTVVGGAGYVGTAVACGGRVRGSGECERSVRGGHGWRVILALAVADGEFDGIAEDLGQGRVDNGRVLGHKGGQGVDGHQVTVAPDDDRASAGEELLDLGLGGSRFGGSGLIRCGHHSRLPGLGSAAESARQNARPGLLRDDGSLPDSTLISAGSLSACGCAVIT